VKRKKISLAKIAKAAKKNSEIHIPALGDLGDLCESPFRSGQTTWQPT
jgi:hypothetical protein